jgi:HlyD family secretion protein
MGSAPATGGSAQSGGILSKMMPRPPRGGSRVTRADNRPPGARQIWVLQEGQPVTLSVTSGISDGRLTEVSGEGLEPGLLVITDQRSSGAGA